METEKFNERSRDAVTKQLIFICKILLNEYIKCAYLFNLKVLLIFLQIKKKSMFPSYFLITQCNNQKNINILCIGKLTEYLKLRKYWIILALQYPV